MTLPTLRALLEAHPDLAQVAVLEAKVASERMGPRFNSMRVKLAGSPVAIVRDEGRRPFGELPDGTTIRARPDEPWAAFCTRVDQGWRDAGWVFSAAVGSAGS